MVQGAPEHFIGYACVSQPFQQVVGSLVVHGELDKLTAGGNMSGAFVDGEVVRRRRLGDEGWDHGMVAQDLHLVVDVVGPAGGTPSQEKREK